MQEEIKAIANAVEEVAKTTGKALDMVQQAGSFVAEYTRTPLETGIGIISDKLVYMRWERQQRFFRRSQEFLAQRGLSAPLNAVPLNFAIPLLEAAALEEDDDLQDLWAALLVNAATSSSSNDRRRAFISMLEQLTPLDAIVLLKIHSTLCGDLSERAAVTQDLPESTHVYFPETPFENLGAPSDDVTLALANLVRIGCLDAEENWGGQKDYRNAYMTVLGRSFCKAVVLRGPGEY
jgi:hypothetical protein